MTYTAKLIERVKENQGIESNYGVAKLVGVRPSQITQWINKNEANGYYTLKLCELAGLDIAMSLKIVTKQVQTTKEGETDQYILC